MLNYLWGAMLLAGIVYGAFNGTLPDITTAAIDSSKEAVALCVTMTGVMSLWMGLMEIAEKSGVLSAATKRIQPFVSFMFPRLPRGHEAREYITTNIIANVFGLGWAATPAGLKAMEALKKFEEERTGQTYAALSESAASNEMCTFLILNISSLQLIPVNIIAYRSQYGSVNPAAVIAPSLAATFASTVTAVIYCKLMDRRK